MPHSESSEAKKTAISKEPQVVSTSQNRGVVAVYRSAGQIWWANMLGGMAWGVGSVIGATLIVALIIFLLTSLGGLPIIGDYLSDLAEKITRGVQNSN